MATNGVARQSSLETPSSAALLARLKGTPRPHPTRHTVWDSVLRYALLLREKRGYWPAAEVHSRSGPADASVSLTSKALICVLPYAQMPLVGSAIATP